jgi:hypothetical protein
MSRDHVPDTGYSYEEGSLMVVVLHLGMMNLVAVLVEDLVGLEVRIVGMREGLTFTRPFTIL